MAGTTGAAERVFHPTRQMLTDLGCRVDLAVDGAEALARARAHAYDLILMDVQMPNLNGMAATRKIRRLSGHKHTPILAITASAFVEDRDDCTRAGMNGYISKPLTPASLARVLSHWLAPSTTPDGDGDGDDGDVASDRRPGQRPGPPARLDSSAMLLGTTGLRQVPRAVRERRVAVRRNDQQFRRFDWEAGVKQSSAECRCAPSLRGNARYSGSVSPDPPISLGTSLILGSPSLIRRTVS